MFLLGLQTGSAYVLAKMRNGKEIMTAKIGIVVRDKVFLIPNGAVWIPIYGVIQYRVEKWRNGRPTGKNCNFFVSISSDSFQILVPW